MTIPPGAIGATLPASRERGRPLRSIAEDLTRYTYFRGRVALSAILRALGVASGDEVLLQAFTCVAVPEGIISVGAIPVYVDVSPGTPNMDPDDLRLKITARTKAIVVQHSYGLPADIRELIRIADEMAVPVIEDCAHTIASRVDGRLVGSFGRAAFYSYEAAKPVFAGIGGSAVINDRELEMKVEGDYAHFAEPPLLAQLETSAMVVAYHVAYRPSTYWTVRALFRALSGAGLIRGNYNKVELSLMPASDFRRRMGRMQVRRLSRALRDIEMQTRHRADVALQYRSSIRTAYLQHLPVRDGVEPIFGRYPMLAANKTELVEKARRAKVEIAVFYDTPVQPLSGESLRGVGYKPGSCPRAERIAASVISLPTGMQVGTRQIRRTVEFLNALA